MSFQIVLIFKEDDWSYVDSSDDEYECNTTNHCSNKKSIKPRKVQVNECKDLWNDEANVSISNDSKSNPSNKCGKFHQLYIMQYLLLFLYTFQIIYTQYLQPLVHYFISTQSYYYF